MKISKTENFLKLISFTLLILFLFLFYFRYIEIEDIWWHLSTGKWIVSNNSIPHQDIFSFSKDKTPWIYTQWLGSCIFYYTYNIGSFLGLKLLRCFIFLISAIIPLIYSRKKLYPPLTMLLTIIFSFGLLSRFLLRPFIFNFIFIQIFLISLFSYQKSLKRKYLFAIPIIGIFWCNIHLGSFVYGNILLSIFIVSAIIEYLKEKFLTKNYSATKKQLTIIKDLIIFSISYIAVFIINPYGLEGFLYPFKVFIDPNFIDFYKFSGLTLEMKSPDNLFSISKLWFIFLSLSCSILLILKRQNKVRNFLLFLIPLIIYLNAKRAGAFYAICCTYIIINCLETVSVPSKFKKGYLLNIAKYTTYFFIIIVLFLNIVKLITTNVYFQNKIVRSIKLDIIPRNPIKSLKVLKDNNIFGKIFTDDGNGGFILWYDYPNLKPIVDGRQLNKNLFNTYLKIINEPHKYWNLVEEDLGINIALIDNSKPSSKYILPYINNLASWQLISIDGPYLLFVKRFDFNLIRQQNNFEQKLKNTESVKNIFIKKLKSLHDRPENFIISYFKPLPIYVDLLEEAKILLKLGYNNAAYKRFNKAFDINESLTRKRIRIRGEK